MSTDHALPAGFMADYVAECAEHLTAVRRALVELESTSDRAAPDPRQLDDLFHAFHSMDRLLQAVDAWHERQTGSV